MWDQILMIQCNIFYSAGNVDGWLSEVKKSTILFGLFLTCMSVHELWFVLWTPLRFFHWTEMENDCIVISYLYCSQRPQKQPVASFSTSKLPKISSLTRSIFWLVSSFHPHQTSQADYDLYGLCLKVSLEKHKFLRTGPLNHITWVALTDSQTLLMNGRTNLMIFALESIVLVGK